MFQVLISFIISSTFLAALLPLLYAQGRFFSRKLLK